MPVQLGGTIAEVPSTTVQLSGPVVVMMLRSLKLVRVASAPWLAAFATAALVMVAEVEVVLLRVLVLLLLVLVLLVEVVFTTGPR